MCGVGCIRVVNSSVSMTTTFWFRACISNILYNYGISVSIVWVSQQKGMWGCMITVIHVYREMHATFPSAILGQNIFLFDHLTSLFY